MPKDYLTIFIIVGSIYVIHEVSKAIYNKIKKIYFKFKRSK